MFEKIDNLRLISIYRGKMEPHTKMNRRKKHSLVFRTSGESVYKTECENFVLKTGDMSFLPKGSSYEFIQTSEVPCEYLSINFEGDIDDAKIKIFSMEGFSERNYIINHFADMWNFGSPIDRLKCYSIFYHILHHLEKTENSDYALKKKFQVLEPAIEYLKGHLYDTSLKSDILHELCGVSNTYFRKVFASKFGVSPKEYIISARLSHARELIDMKNISKINEISLAVGYTDPLYFSRAFKKKYGISPSEIK